MLFPEFFHQESLHFLTSLAVEKYCVLKQSDCKIAFCQPHHLLSIDNCPIFKRGTLWRLNKTFVFGLRRSPRHWYYKFRSTLLSLWDLPNASMILASSTAHPLYS